MIHSFFTSFRTYFELDHRQAKTYLFLLLITFLSLCSPLFTYYASPLFYSNQGALVFLDTVSLDERVTISVSDAKKSGVFFRKKIEDLNEEDWKNAGLPHYLSKRILNYQSKGARLTKIKHLYKIYGMDSNLVAKVTPYLIESQEGSMPNKKTEAAKKQTTPKQRMDINEVDTSTLDGFPAIGPVFAKRIIQYRILLGGYVSVEQYKEIYGITPEIIAVLTSRTFVSPRPLCPLKEADYLKLNKHLYLSSKDARYILLQLKSNPEICWDELSKGLEQKAVEHVSFLKEYFPCP